MRHADRFDEHVPGRAGDLVAGLSGTGRVADDLYLLGHHEISGRPYLQPRAIGIGLAGALLAELLLSDNIWIGPDGVAVARSDPPMDGLARHVLRLVAAEHEQRPVRDWLLYLGRTAAGDAARRLEQSGYLARAGGRWRRGRWVAVDRDCAFAPLLRSGRPWTRIVR